MPLIGLLERELQLMDSNLPDLWAEKVTADLVSDYERYSGSIQLKGKANQAGAGPEAANREARD